jgi:anhydro-N-acetylmuramic acid kinase
MTAHYIGLMSGTSLDGVDGVVVAFEATSKLQHNTSPSISVDTAIGATHKPVSLRVLAHQALPFSATLKAELLSLNTASHNELHRAALAANALTEVYAQTVQLLLQRTGLTAQDIRAIGAHGQTVRHQPGLHDGVGYTTQLNNPALLAERTGICVVADFRSRDVAAGGQGAPLVPAFHAGVFGDATHTVAVLNIGGIANISVLKPPHDVMGFDTGPGNALLDHWCQQHTGQPFDNAGAWGQQGQVMQALLTQLLQDAYFQQTPPKSTGRDLFHPAWLNAHLQHFAHVKPVDVQATLTEFTALTCSADVQRYAADARELIVCGGGALNTALMQRLQANLTATCHVVSSAERGMPPLQVEAAAFAWLAQQTLQGLPGNLPKVTGAKGARILGGIYPA